jgi:hypothetical protein
MAIGSMVGRDKLEDLEQYYKALKPATLIYDLFKEKITILSVGRFIRFDIVRFIGSLFLKRGKPSTVWGA